MCRSKIASSYQGAASQVSRSCFSIKFFLLVFPLPSFCFIFSLCLFFGAFLFLSVSRDYGKSFLQNFFFLFVFMVDYSLVRLDCPSISFFFACLCGFLVSKGRGGPQVNLFIGQDCPFRNILVFLFLVIPLSLSFTQLLSRMLGEGEV